jgi:opacity protein-like surface antigen
MLIRSNFPAILNSLQLIEELFIGLAGINYELSPQLTLGLEFIYFGAGSPTFHQDGISPTIDYQSEEVFLTMSYRLQ